MVSVGTASSSVAVYDNILAIRWPGTTFRRRSGHLLEVSST